MFNNRTRISKIDRKSIRSQWKIENFSAASHKNTENFSLTKEICVKNKDYL